ncbi:hypothetical protein IMW82_14190 [Rhodanobacter sp. B2A1Ga4]|uniref:hypothetical protein n=1 Tax=Rhodanobacter sp. B2A1Ga4 TaxID=2778647 RepID=UPI001B393D90|nr:hypothetical protein [Rhodanobacter sp. B2A1Ga4]MBQ4855822.1 hypothetical protein [Rhodanobacter sp. B2A1Ga4]
MFIRYVFVLAGAVLLSSCVTVAGSKGPPAALKGKDVYYDTQTVMGPCPGQGESALLVALGSAVIAKGVSKIGDAIKAAGQLDTQTLNARRNIELQTDEGLPPCVFVARGWFFREHHDSGADFYSVPGASFSATPDTVSGKFWRIGLDLAATPDFYFVGRFTTSTDKSANAIMPMEAVLNSPASRNLLRPSGTRYVMVAFALSEVGAATDISKGGGATITLGAMKLSERLKLAKSPLEDAMCAEDAWTRKTTDRNHLYPSGRGCPSQDDIDHLRFLMRSPFESNWFTVKSFNKPTPMLLQALVTETQNPSKFLQFVGDVFGATQDSITKELQRALIPSVGNDATAAEDATNAAAKADFDKVQGQAITALKACVAAPSDPNARIAARGALWALQEAGSKDKHPTGALSPDSIKINGKSKVECETQLNAVLVL